jgi:hypothetical protein
MASTASMTMASMASTRRRRAAMAACAVAACVGVVVVAGYWWSDGDGGGDGDDDEGDGDEGDGDEGDGDEGDEGDGKGVVRRGGDARSATLTRALTRSMAVVVSRGGGDEDCDGARATTLDAAATTMMIDVKHTSNAIAVYESLELAFAAQGLDKRALSPRQFFHFSTYPEVGVWPQKYAAVDGYARDCARLVILSLEDAPAIAAAVQQSTRELVTMLGGTLDAFAPGRANLHVSMFHLSRTHEYIKPPVAFAVDDAVRNGTKRLIPHVSSTAPSEAIKYEESAVADALRGAGPVTLEVDRVCIAPSGCLLLCFNDVNGDAQNVRERLRDNAIGAARAQNETVHCTLARLFPKEDAALSDAMMRDMNALCARWTARLRGARMVARNVVYVVEERYGFCDGHRTRISLAAGA